MIDNIMAMNCFFHQDGGGYASGQGRKFCPKIKRQVRGSWETHATCHQRNGTPDASLKPARLHARESAYRFNHPFPQTHPGQVNRLRAGMVVVRFGRPRCQGYSVMGHPRRKALLKLSGPYKGTNEVSFLSFVQSRPGSARHQDRRSSLTNSLHPHLRGNHSSRRVTVRANPSQGRADPSAKLRSASLKPRLTADNRRTHTWVETRGVLASRQHPRLG